MVIFDPSVSKASGGPREGKELCQRSTSQGSTDRLKLAVHLTQI